MRHVWNRAGLLRILMLRGRPDTAQSGNPWSTGKQVQPVFLGESLLACKAEPSL